jgi:DNA-directed RNA polymerase subunit beta
MPQLEDGRHADICINPMGIISRMNIGQLYEAHLSETVYNLKNQLRTMLSENKSQEEIQNYLLKYIEIVDNTKTKWYLTQFKEQLTDIDEKFIDELTIVQPPFESIKFEQLQQVMEYTNSKFKHKIYDPISKKYILNPIAIGYMYFIKMIHMSENKLAARGIGAYSRRTLQPLGGKKLKGGQKLGEMETACLIAHDALHNLFEFFTTKSDCIDMKNKFIKDNVTCELIEIPEELNKVPESTKLLKAYFKTIGVEM